MPRSVPRRGWTRQPPACVSITATPAAHYVAGLLRYQSGHTSQSLSHLKAARDHDVCPLRATTAMMESVRRQSVPARAPSLVVVDTPKLLDLRNRDGQRIPDGVPDPEYFLDHVHPTIAGHQAIAEEVAAEILALAWFEVSPRAGEVYRVKAETHLASLGEDYYARGKQRLAGLKRWVEGRAGELGVD